jgi:hypothetical protein
LSQLITTNFFSVPIALNQFFASIALGDVDLHFSLLLLTKSSAVEEETE